MQKKTFWEARYKSLIDFYSDDKNVEEIICDEYALNISLQLGDKLFPEEFRLVLLPMLDDLPIKICQACYVGLENLNTFSRCEYKIKSRDRTSGDSVSRTIAAIPDNQTRKRCFLNTIIHTMTNGKPRDPHNKDMVEYWIKTTKEIDSKYDLIADVLLDKPQSKYYERMKDKVLSIMDNEELLQNQIESALYMVKNW